jgi:hypothetical protein
MEMDLHDTALQTAGVIGVGVALIHGVLTQRYMVTPFTEWAAGEGGLRRSARKLVPPLLQFSTFNWFVGGLALIAAPFWSDHDGKLVIGLLVSSSYLYGALANFWSTGGRHPGWLLYAVALLLIGFGVSDGCRGHGPL